MTRTAFLQIGERRIAGLISSGRDVGVCFSEPLPEGFASRSLDDRAAAVREILSKANFNETSVSIVVPRSFVILRELSIPPGSLDETIQMIRFQVEKEMPLPIEKIRWTYVPLEQREGKERVLATAVPSEILDGWSDLLSRAGLKVRACYSTTMGIAGWVPDKEGVVAVAYAFDAAVEILLLNDGRFAASNTIAAADLPEREVVDEIHRSLMSYTARYPQHPVKRLYLFDGSETLRARAAELMSTEMIPLSLPAEAAPMMGLASAVGAHDPMARDLLKPPSIRKKVRLGSKQRIAVLVGVAMVAAYAFFWMSAGDREAELERQTSKVKSAKVQYKALTGLKKQVETAEQWSDHRAIWLDVYQHLTSVIDTKEAYLVSLSIDEEGNVQMVGRGKRQEQAPQLAQKIKGLGKFSDASFGGFTAVDDKQGFGVEFSITAKWMP